MSKTIRRDWLKKQVEAGKIESKCVFEIEHDGTGAYDRFGGDWLEARIRRPRFEEITNCYGNKQSVCADSDFIEGKSNFMDSDFTTKSGGAYLSGVDVQGRKLYSFHIHSNSCYTLREKVAQESAKEGFAYIGAPMAGVKHIKGESWKEVTQ